jgi:hypothetical protein
MREVMSEAVWMADSTRNVSVLSFLFVLHQPSASPRCGNQSPPKRWRITTRLLRTTGSAMMQRWPATTVGASQVEDEAKEKTEHTGQASQRMTDGTVMVMNSNAN